MKYVKMLGLLAVTAAAMLAFAGTASATELTSPKGTKLLNGTILGATAKNVEVHGSIKLTCKHSFIVHEITDSGGATTTVKTSSKVVESLDFDECGPDTVTSLDPGILEIHTKNAASDNTGTVTATGLAFTIQFHRSVLGFPITTHCIYETSGTHLGTLIGSNHEAQKTAILRISAAIPVAVTDSACGNDAKWTGDYLIDTVDEVFVD